MLRNNKYTLPQKNKKGKIVVVLGPTASGKSDLAIELARKFNGEIICGDSRQIYSEMDIGTAKPKEVCPPTKQRRADLLQSVPHHLFGIVKPNKQFNVGKYQKLAIKTIKDIQRRGKLPILVGGTAFYLYSVIDGWQFPKSKADPGLRKKLEAHSPTELFKMLKKLDFQRAQTIDSSNKQRLLRAIEMAQQLGSVPTIQKTPLFDCLLLGANPGQVQLAKRITLRVEKMFKLGLENEVKTLVKKYGFNPLLQTTIGYAEWKEPGSFPKRSLAPSASDAVEKQIILHTIQFAKKQMTWFKKDSRIHWLPNNKKAQEIVKNFLD